jgi:hypothetical protein
MRAGECNAIRCDCRVGAHIIVSGLGCVDGGSLLGGGAMCLEMGMTSGSVVYGVLVRVCFW